jgi:sec-independent protein translocase protein TatA
MHYHYNIVLAKDNQGRHSKMPNIGAPELIIILVILLLLFGAKKLPELARSVGSSAKELRNSMKDDKPSEDKDKKES